MSEFRLEDKTRIINSPTRYNFRFLDNNNNVTAAATATQLDIQGYGRFRLSNIFGARLTRGQFPTTEKWSLTAATPAEITISGPIPNNTYVHVEMVVRSSRRALALARPEYEFGRTFTFSVMLSTGETANTFLAKLYNSIVTLRNDKNRDLFIAPGSGTAGTISANDVATTLTELEIELLERGSYIESFRVTNDNGSPSNYVTIFNPTRIQDSSEGIGYGSDVEFREKVTGNNNIPYGFDFADIPHETELYTEIYWGYDVSNRPDPKSSRLSNRPTMVLYMKESSCEPLIDNLADFFNQVPGTQFSAVVSGTYVKDTATVAQFKTNA
jgi:hypothetical protein